MILTIYFTVFFLEFLIDWILNILNLNTLLKNRDSVPAVFTGFIDEAIYRRSLDYNQKNIRFSLFHSVQSRMIAFLIVITGAGGVLNQLIGRWDLGTYWMGVILLGGTAVLLSLVSLPLSLYRVFVLEEEFGFNTSSFKTYIADKIKGTVVTLIFLAILLGGIYASIALTGKFWWLTAWGAVTAIQFLFTMLYPIFIAPLFNKFTPLPEGELKETLLSLAQRCRFAVSGIFVMDGSRRSRHSNAYFTGIGRFRRIVLFDTLVENLSTDELAAVLAHEIGHSKHGHIRKALLVSILLSLGLFALAGLAMKWDVLYTAFGFSQPSLRALLFIVSFLSAPFVSLCSPIGNIWSRRNEYEADRYAVSQVESAAPMKNALLNLTRDNLGNLVPHPAYSFFNYSHPVLSERLAAIEKEGLALKEKVR